MVSLIPSPGTAGMAVWQGVSCLPTTSTRAGWMPVKQPGEEPGLTHATARSPRERRYRHIETRIIPNQGQTVSVIDDPSRSDHVPRQHGRLHGVGPISVHLNDLHIPEHADEDQK